MILGILAGYPGFLLAQGMSPGDTLTSKRGTKVLIKDERSSKMSIIAQAMFFNLECSTGDALRIGGGVEGDYFLPKLASVHVDYTGTYLDIQSTNAKDLDKGSNSLGKFSVLDLGGRFHFYDKQALKHFKTKLSHHASFVDQYNSGNTIPENYLIMRLPARRIFSIRGGLYRSTAIASTDMNKSELAVGDYGAVKAKDGTVFTNAYFTNSHTTGVYVGISEIFNMWVRIHPLNTDEFDKTYRNALFREVYADVILATTSFDPFTVGGKSYEIEPNTKGSFQTSPIGFRIGKKVVVTRKTVNLGFSFELGDRPGVAGRGAYFGCGMSAAFVK